VGPKTIQDVMEKNFTLEQAMKAWAWPLYPLERNLIPTVQETGWAPVPFWSGAESAYNRIQSLDPPVCRKLLYPLYWPGQQNSKNKI